MPTLAEFAGLKVCMYREDRSPHHFPHVHAYFAEYDAVIRVPDGDLIESDDAFPKSKLRLVQVWVDLHSAELMENWRLIGSDKKFFRISPLEIK